MNKIKIYLFGLILLLGGMAIGYWLKPTESVVHHHENDSIEESSVWTCSMHPQIRQEEPGICPICEMDLIPLDGVPSNDDPTVLQMSEEAVKLAQVETTIVGAKGRENTGKTTSSTITVDGTIEMDERSIKTQNAHFNGRIESMAITFEGQYVRKGQKIATIYSTELMAASEELITAVKYKDRISGLQEAAIQKLKNWKLTEEQIQTILENQQPITTLPIFAEYGGYVLQKMATQGEYIKQGEPLYSLGSTNNLWLVFQVFESDLSRIGTGQNISFTTSSLPTKKFESEITYINPLLDDNSRTATVRAEIRNAANVLKPGMLIRGEISPRKEKGEATPLVIPNTAILWTGKRSVVYVKIPDETVPTFQFKEVVVRERGDYYSTISEGLNAGEEIVTHGAFSIDAAAQLNNNFSMMNREVTIKKPFEGKIIPDFSVNVPAGFMESLDQLVVEYLSLKDALVNTDPSSTATFADKLINEMDAVNSSGLEDEALNFWLEQKRAMKDHAVKIKDHPANVDTQRDEFEYLSEALISFVKAFGTNNQEYYVQFCPMAKNDKGANWLSKEEAIRNPYFGDKMLKCGVVKMVLN